MFYKNWQFWMGIAIVLAFGLAGFILGSQFSAFEYNRISNAVSYIDGVPHKAYGDYALEPAQFSKATTMFTVFGLFCGLIVSEIFRKKVTKSYWLRGGIIFLILFASSAPLIFYLDTSAGGIMSGFGAMLYLIGLGQFAFGIDGLIQIIPSILFTIIIYFFIGAIMGWFYGVTKNIINKTKK